MMNRIWGLFCKFILHPLSRYVLAWLVALGAASISLYLAWNAFDAPKRPDGNEGHTTIDFGGQWLMGRMLVQGHGRHLYNRNYQREVLREAYPRHDEVPIEERDEKEKETHDAENLMDWLIGPDERGGPLYPPIHALLYSPLALLRPQPAYRVIQVAGIVLALAAGLGVAQLTQGRIWWPVAVVAVIVYPGFNPALQLGQNASLTLTLLIGGWVLVARGRTGWGGFVWGLLAFKPVWAAAFFLVPLVTRRWRTCLAMLGTGTALAAATLPVVGWQAWHDWLHVGRDAAQLYNTDQNWITLSRDLLGIPRRWLLDFSAPAAERDRLYVTLIGWALLLAAVEFTVRLAVLRKHQAQTIAGPVPAFLFLGAWLSCFHFMYYDVLLTALPVFLLFTEPRRYLEPIFLAVVPLSRGGLGNELARYYQPWRARAYPPSVPLLRAGHPHVWVLNRMVPSLVLLLLAIEHLFPLLGIEVKITAGFLPSRLMSQSAHLSTTIYEPWDTYCLIVLWLWCGWLWIRDQESGVRDQESGVS